MMTKRKGVAAVSTRSKRRVSNSNASRLTGPASSKASSAGGAALPVTQNVWQWEERGVWNDYGPNEQNQINQRFGVDPKRKFKLALGSTRYTVDLGQFTQKNDRTGYVRKIRIRTKSGNSGGSSGVWQWEEFGVFQNYRSSDQRTLEDEFLINPKGSFTMTMFGTRYIVDFGTMTQTNTRSGYIRRIQRRGVSCSGYSASESGSENESASESEEEGEDNLTCTNGASSTDIDDAHAIVQQLTKWVIVKDTEKLKGHNCAICLCEYEDEEDEVQSGSCVKLSKCGEHYFHKECIVQAFKHKKQCPACTTRYGPETGTQPNGEMNVRTLGSSLAGFRGTGTIVIEYNFPSGMQGPEHPQPGKHYSGTSRVAYLPNNTEGKRVLGLFKRAFKQRVMFTIGTSITTGLSNCVIWNGVHHKTSKSGGAANFGYPDPTYLSRVQQELASKGITADDEL